TSGGRRTWTSATSRETGGRSLLRFGCQRREPSIRRVYDQRRLTSRFSALIPIVWRTNADPVGAPIRIVAALDGGIASRDEGIMTHGFRGIDGKLFISVRLFSRKFRIVEKSSGSKLFGTLHWDTDHVDAGPHALQIRIAPWCLWRGPRLRGRFGSS